MEEGCLIRKSSTTSQAALPWTVLRTKTRCEKYVRDLLQQKGIEAFVPVRSRTAKYNRKVKKYELPLISCYTFVRMDTRRKNEVLALPYVQGMLRSGGQDCIVSEREMLWLQKIGGSDLEVRAETLSLKQGDKVVLAYGQLAGIEGKILSEHSRHEVIIALESLGLQLVLQVQKEMLEKI